MGLATSTAIRDTLQTATVQTAVDRFVNWLDGYGETSYDHQSFFASDLGRSAKALYYKQPLLGTLAVSPMIFSEAFLPSARRLFWKPQRFPIADAHYAMGFAFLSQASGHDQHYRRAVRFLEVLKETRCPGYENYCLGIPIQLGDAARHNQSRYASHNHRSLCLRGCSARFMRSIGMPMASDHAIHRPACASRLSDFETSSTPRPVRILLYLETRPVL